MNDNFSFVNQSMTFCWVECSQNWSQFEGFLKSSSPHRSNESDQKKIFTKNPLFHAFSLSKQNINSIATIWILVLNPLCIISIAETALFLFALDRHERRVTLVKRKNLNCKRKQKLKMRKMIWKWLKMADDSLKWSENLENTFSHLRDFSWRQKSGKINPKTAKKLDKNAKSVKIQPQPRNQYKNHSTQKQMQSLKWTTFNHPPFALLVHMDHI